MIRNLLRSFSRLAITRAALFSFVLMAMPTACVVAEQHEAERQSLLNRAQRIVFLGDSITYAGEYVALFDAWLLSQEWETHPVVINVGLPSETVSGLSEEGHAGGKFSRPDLGERLQRVLTVTRPDLVFACYGINCGIYQPLDDARFERYRQGVRNLKRHVEAAGAELVLITPPFHDDARGGMAFSYNAVLDRYARWLMARRDDGWLVVDLHGPMTREVTRQRESDPDFTFQPDAVHPNQMGHWFIARQLYRWFGDEVAASRNSLEDLFANAQRTQELLEVVRERMKVRRDAYLSAAGHERPGIRPGLPIAAAEQRAEILTAKIRTLTGSEP